MYKQRALTLLGQALRRHSPALLAAIVALGLGACSSSASQATALNVAPVVTTSQSVFSTYIASLTPTTLATNSKAWNALPFSSYSNLTGSGKSWQIDGMTFSSNSEVLSSYGRINAALGKKFSTFGKYRDAAKIQTRKPTLAQFKLAMQQLHDFYNHKGIFAKTNLSLTSGGFGLLEGESGGSTGGSGGSNNGLNCAQTRQAQSGLGAFAALGDPASAGEAVARGAAMATARQNEINGRPVPEACSNEDYAKFHSTDCGGGAALQLLEENKDKDLAATLGKPISKGIPDPLAMTGLASGAAGMIADVSGCPAEGTGDPVLDGINGAVAGSSTKGDGSPTGDQSHAPDFTTGGADPCEYVNGVQRDPNHCFLSGPGVP